MIPNSGETPELRPQNVARILSQMYLAIINPKTVCNTVLDFSLSLFILYFEVRSLG